MFLLQHAPKVHLDQKRLVLHIHLAVTAATRRLGSVPGDQHVEWGQKLVHALPVGLPCDTDPG